MNLIFDNIKFFKMSKQVICKELLFWFINKAKYTRRMSNGSVRALEGLVYSDDSLIRTRLFPLEISGLTSFPDYWISQVLTLANLLENVLNSSQLIASFRGIYVTLIRAVYCFFSVCFWPFGRFIASFRYVFGPEKGRLVYSRLSVCVLEFNITCNEISVIYVTAQMCRRTEEEVVLTCTVGLPMP